MTLRDNMTSTTIMQNICEIEIENRKQNSTCHAIPFIDQENMSKDGKN